MTDQELLELIENAIKEILEANAEEVTVGDKTYKRPDLPVLMEMRDKLKKKIAAQALSYKTRVYTKFRGDV